MAQAGPVPILAAEDPVLPEIITVHAALAAGLTKDQVRQRVRSGRWTRVARGSYVRTASLEAASSPYERQARVKRAAILANLGRHPGAVIGFHSGALMHSLPLWGRTPVAVSLIVPPEHWTGTRGGVTFRSLHLSDIDLEPGAPHLTSVARTWFDVARTSRLSAALSFGDAALRAGRMTMDEVTSRLAAGSGLNGTSRAVRAAQHLCGLRETPLESASWAYFVRHGLPLPRMQVVIVDDGGNVIARVDFLWEEFGLVGECDGRIKYADPEALYSEKRREDAIRQRGLGMVRWGSRDLANDVFARRMRLLLR